MSLEKWFILMGMTRTACELAHDKVLHGTFLLTKDVGYFGDIFVRKPKGKRPLGIARHGKIKMDLNKV
jgi:hypothetical protein